MCANRYTTKIARFAHTAYVGPLVEPLPAVHNTNVSAMLKVAGGGNRCCYRCVSHYMALRSSILRVMAYFDLFSYPLAVGDVVWFLDVEASQEAVWRELERLAQEGRVFRLGGYYSLQNDPTLAMRRLRGEAHADELLAIADRGARLLYQFPFVRGVCISGSLSKRCADEKADIDYFIITKANRLWIARTLMHLFKKLTYLWGHQHRYCMNYYIDEEALEIKEKNIFTAVEMLTVLPICGNGGLVKFFDANEWTARYLPHYGSRSREAKIPRRPTLLKRVLEQLLNNRLGNAIDNYLRDVTDKRWKKKTRQGKINTQGHTMSLQCGKHHSRPNPEFFQQRIINRYQRRIREVMTGRSAAVRSSGKK